VTLGIDSLFQTNKSLNLALIAPIVFRSIISSFSIVLVDMFLIVAGISVEELLLFHEPVVGQNAVVSVKVCSLENSASALVRK